MNQYRIDGDRAKELKYFCYQYKKLSRPHQEMIEQAAIAADPELYEWLLLGVTNKGTTYNNLRTLRDMPCGVNKYTRIRQKFFWLLDQKRE